MAEVSIKPVRLYDSDGDALDDGNGKLNVNVSGSGSANLGKAEDTAHSSGDVGVMALGVRNDTLAALGGADGDYAPLQVNATGALFVDIADGGQLDTLIDLNNTLHVLQATTNTNTGTIAGDTTEIAANFLTPGIAFSAQKGIACSAVRNDALENLYVSVGDGDWTSLQVNSIGGLYITGSEVENAAVQSQPLLMGGRYDSSARTLGDGDAGAIALNASGALYVDVTSTAHPAGNGTFTSYARFTAATTATALTDSTNGINTTETAAKEVIIQADHTNSSYIMVGSSGVTATTNGVRLNAGDTLVLPIANIANIYIDGETSSQNVFVVIIK